MTPDVFSRSDLGRGFWELGRRLGEHDDTPACRNTRRPRGWGSAFPVDRSKVLAVDVDAGQVLVLESGRPATDWMLTPLTPTPTFALPVDDLVLVTDRASNCVVLHRRDGPARVLDLGEHGVCHGPTSVALTLDGLIVVAAALDGLVLAVDRDNRERWRLDARDGLVQPWGVTATGHGGVVVADIRLHQILEFDAARRVGFAFGSPHHAGKGPDQLNAPRYACHTPGGGFLIADTKNNRVVQVADDGEIVSHWGSTEACGAAPGLLWHPTTAVPVPGGGLIVAEGSGRRVVRLSDDGAEAMLHGRSAMWRNELALPRGAHFAGGGIVVTDCYNDRVLLIGPDGRTRRQVDAVRGTAKSPRFDWPRFACLHRRELLVADGRNGRVVALDERSVASLEVTAYQSGSRSHPFADPHHVVPSGSTLLVTDSAANVVVEIEPGGRCLWRFDELDDPHCASVLPGDRILVCDTGNHRIIEVNRAGKICWELSAGRVEALTGVPLRHPRGAVRRRDGGTVVVDTDNDRILLVRAKGGVLDLTGVMFGCTGSLAAPRYIAADERGETYLVSDFDNCRLLGFTASHLGQAAEKEGRSR